MAAAPAQPMPGAAPLGGAVGGALGALGGMGGIGGMIAGLPGGPGVPGLPSAPGVPGPVGTAAVPPPPPPGAEPDVPGKAAAAGRGVQPQTVTIKDSDHPGEVRTLKVTGGPTRSLATIKDPDESTADYTARIKTLSDKELETAVRSLSADELVAGSPLEREHTARQARKFKEGAKQAALGFGLGAQRSFQGARQLATKGAEAIGMAAPGAEQRYTEAVNRARQRDIATVKGLTGELGPAFKTGEIIGGAAPYGPIPAGGALKSLNVAGRVLTRMGIGAATGAGVGATQFVQPGSSRYRNALLGVALGAGASAMGPILGYGLRKVGRTLKPTTEPTEGMLMRQAARMKKADIPAVRQQEKLTAAAKRLDTTLTPGELTQAPRLRGMEGRLAPGQKGIVEASVFAKGRETVLKTKMRETISSVLPKGTTAKQVKDTASKMYEDLSKQPVSAATKSAVNKDPVLQQFMKEAMGVKASRASLYPKNSAGRLIETEKYLKEMIKGGTAKSNTVAQATIKKIQGLVDTDFVKYADARALAQRGIIYRNMMDDYESIGLKAGEEVPVVDQMYGKFFGSIGKQKAFIKDIGQAGGNTKQAADVIRVLSKVKGSTFEKILMKDTRVVSPHTAAQGFGGTTLGGTRKAFMFHHDNQMVRMLTNPNYADEINRLVKMGPGPKFGDAFTNFISKVSALEGVKFFAEPPPRAAPGAAPGAARAPIVDRDHMPEVKRQLNKHIAPDDAVAAAKTPMSQQIPVSISHAVLSDTKNKKDFDKATKILAMSPEKFYKEALSTPAKQAEVMAYMKKNGAKHFTINALQAQLDMAARTKRTTAATAQLAKAKLEKARTEMKAKKKPTFTRVVGARRLPKFSKASRARLSAIIQQLVLAYIARNPKLRQLLGNFDINELLG
jgi:hypothetical protein